MDIYIGEIKSIDDEIVRLKTVIKDLTDIKKDTIKKLKETMAEMGIEKYAGYELHEKVKVRPKLKKKKARVVDGIDYLRSIGVPDPKLAYEEFIKSQRHT